MFQELLKKMAEVLEAHSIPYMLIGGQAVLLYGEPRLTEDVDVTLGIGPEKAADIIDIVNDELRWEILVKNPTEFVNQTFVLPSKEPGSGIRVDFIFSSSEYERQAMERVRLVEIGGASVRFASAEDVVIHKIIAARPRDIEDVKSILLKNPDIDSEYIRRWLGSFEEALSQPLLQRFNEVRKRTKGE